MIEKIFDIDVFEISLEEYSSLINKLTDVPFYVAPEAIASYSQFKIIAAKKFDKILAVYAVPIVEKFQKKIVKRQYRITPYTTPLLIESLSTLQTKNVYMALFSYLKKHNVISLPLDLKFTQVMALQSLGIFVEQRSTHIIDNLNTIQKLSSKIKNHINHAKKEVNIKLSTNYFDFNFNQAIAGDEKEVKTRKTFAEQLLNINKAKIFNAVQNDKVVAGIFVAFDNNCAYLVHSWQNEKTPRGTIPYLIISAINKMFEIGIQKFDFEGSVINSIDNFFASFNTKVYCYPYIHYALDKKEFYDLIDTSLNIKGRQMELDEEL